MQRVPVIQATLGFSALWIGNSSKNRNMSWSHESLACYPNFVAPATKFGRQIPHLFSKKRKQFSQFCFVWAPTVFTDFKRFGVFDLPGAVLAVPFLQLRAKAVRS